jgi:hypothetical protein
MVIVPGIDPTSRGLKWIEPEMVVDYVAEFLAQFPEDEREEAKALLRPKLKALAVIPEVPALDPQPSPDAPGDAADAGLPQPDRPPPVNNKDRQRAFRERRKAKIEKLEQDFTNAVEEYVAEMAPDDLLAPLGRQDRPQQAGFLKQIIDLLGRSDRFRIEVMDGQDRARVMGAEVYPNALDQVVLLIRCQGYHPQAADMVSVHRPEEQQLRSYRRDIVKLIRRRYVTRP